MSIMDLFQLLLADLTSHDLEPLLLTRGFVAL